MNPKFKIGDIVRHKVFDTLYRVFLIESKGDTFVYRFQRSDEILEEVHLEKVREKNLFTDFTTVNWVNFNDRSPDDSLFIYVKFDGGRHMDIMYYNKRNNSIRYEGYSENVIDIRTNSMWWLNEEIDVEGYENYLKTIY